MVKLPSIPRGLRSRLLAFYHLHKRDLPWRATSDPYAIWVSEIMLQQTQVKTVLPRYTAFLELFPTIDVLAEATEEAVCEAWAGLGYYRRARNLRRGARYVVTEFGGAMPNSATSLEKIPGIGRYTAGAIASIAFKQEAPLVDGNVVRFLARLFALPGDKEDRELKKILWRLCEKLVQGEAPGDFNQSLMEQGATICTPVAPKCDECSVQSLCKSFRQGNPLDYPAPSRKVKRQALFVAFGWHENSRGVWLEQRGLEGLWSGLWEPPSGQGTTQQAALAALRKKVTLNASGPLVTVRHILTHRNVEAAVYEIEKLPRARSSHGKRYLKPLGAPLSGLARKAITQTNGAT